MFIKNKFSMKFHAKRVYIKKFLEIKYTKNASTFYLNLNFESNFHTNFKFTK